MTTMKDLFSCYSKHDAGIKSVENELNSVLMIGSSGLLLSLLCGLSESMIIKNELYGNSNNIKNIKYISFILQSSLFPSSSTSRIQLALNLFGTSLNNSNNIKLINNYQFHTVGKFRTFASILCFGIITLNCSLAYREGIKFYENGVYNGIAPIKLNNNNNNQDTIIIRIGNAKEISDILINNKLSSLNQLIPVVFNNNNNNNNNNDNNKLLYSISKASQNFNRSCYYNTITAPDMLKNTLKYNKKIKKIIIQTSDNTLTIDESKLILSKYTNIIGIPCELLYIQSKINKSNDDSSNYYNDNNVKIISIQSDLVLKWLDSICYKQSNIVSTSVYHNNNNNNNNNHHHNDSNNNNNHNRHFNILPNVIVGVDMIGLFVRNGIETLFINPLMSISIYYNNISNYIYHYTPIYYNTFIKYIKKTTLNLNDILHSYKLNNKPLKYIIYFDVPKDTNSEGNWIYSLYNTLVRNKKYLVKKELPINNYINNSDVLANNSCIIIYQNNDYDTIQKAKMYSMKYKRHILIILNDDVNIDVNGIDLLNISMMKLQDLYEDSWKDKK